MTIVWNMKKRVTLSSWKDTPHYTCAFCMHALIASLLATQQSQIRFFFLLFLFCFVLFSITVILRYNKSLIINQKYIYICIFIEQERKVYLRSDKSWYPNTWVGVSLYFLFIYFFSEKKNFNGRTTSPKIGVSLYFYFQREKIFNVRMMSSEIG